MLLVEKFGSAWYAELELMADSFLSQKDKVRNSVQ